MSDTSTGRLARLGDIPPERVWLTPTPGTATERDAIDAWDRDRRLCELVDGTLVEKFTGIQDGYVGSWLAHLLMDGERTLDRGFCIAGTGMIRTTPGTVRIPDIAFFSWERTDDGLVPNVAIPDYAPDLAIEVISEGNRPKEMENKLHEYFDAGVPLVWYVDPEDRTVRVFTSPDEVVTLGVDGTLDGGDVLPGFVLPVARIFERLA